jgi:hypothetical protein
VTATLPRTLERVYVETMRMGEARWANPGAMQVSSDRSLWLLPRAEVYIEPTLVCSMRVERRNDGYHVWAALDHAYEVTAGEPYAGDHMIPVQELHERQLS